jgi:hypothetical protein
VTLRLWLPPLYRTALARRDPLLVAIGALEAESDGTFPAHGDYYQLLDAIRRGCGVVDPVAPELASLL